MEILLGLTNVNHKWDVISQQHDDEGAATRQSMHLRVSTTPNRLIFQLCFIMLKIKLYVGRILCENFIQIGQKLKKL